MYRNPFGPGKRLLVLFVLAWVMNPACHTRESADLLMYHATFYSMDKASNTYEALAVRGGKIIALGTERDLRAAYTFKEELNLNGQFVYPGFLDAHAHLIGYGLGLTQVNLNGSTSWDEVLQKVRAYAVQYPDGWIRGRGWDQNLWGGQMPDNANLDSLFPDRPVVLTRIDGHALIANSRALQLAGIKGNEQITGGEILLHKGKPTGVLIDAAMEKVYQVIPLPNATQLKEALRQAEDSCFSVGLTSVVDAGLDTRTLLWLDSMAQKGEMRLHVYAMVSAHPKELAYWLPRPFIQRDLLNVRSFKLYADGALGSRGACLLEPYADRPDHHGFLIQSPDSLDWVVRQTAKTSWQLNTHCIGDSANRLMLKLYGKHLKDRTDHRWRIEHAQVVTPEDRIYFTESNIIPSVQPTHATSDMAWAPQRLGAGRMEGAYAYQSLLDAAGLLALGSDFPVESINPLWGFYAAVSRKDLNGNPIDGFLPGEALSREEALKGMTAWAAYAQFQEQERGTLEPGKRADLVILDQDLLQVEEFMIPHLKVRQTYVSGQRMYPAIK